MILFLVIIGLALLILIHEFGHFIAAKLFGARVIEFGLGFPPRIVNKKIGETQYSIGIFPLGGFVKIYGETPDDFDKDTGNASDSFLSKSIFKRSAIILAGVLMNVFLAWIIFSCIFFIGSEKQVLITEVAENSPAAVAGIKNNDVLRSVSSQSEKLDAVIESDEFIRFVKRNSQKEMVIQVEREGKEFSFILQGRENPPRGEGSLGVALAGIGIDKKTFFSALYEGGTATLSMLWMIVNGFIGLFGNMFTNPDVLKSVSGPVGIFSLATQAGSFGLMYLFEFIALISLNLAVLNFIPFPALDGGRFLFLIIEWIRGSAISIRLQNIINVAGFAALILLVIFATIQDVTRLL